MNIKTIPSSEVLETTAESLNEAFKEQSDAGKEFLFLSSGGSCLKLLDHLHPEYFGPHSTISVLDERYSTDPTISNMAQVQKTGFYTEILSRGARVIDTNTLQGESIEDAAARFEQGLRAWVKETNGTIIASVGIGANAHTGGMMPFPEDPAFFEKTFMNDAHWIASYDANGKDPQRLRITCTIPFFKKITTAILYVTGETKRQPLEKLLAEDGTLAESPCRVWREVPGAVLYTDLSL